MSQNITIDEKRAKQIAQAFLEQHHSVSKLTATLMNQVWVIKAEASCFGELHKIVRVNANTGTILSVV